MVGGIPDSTGAPGAAGGEPRNTPTLDYGPPPINWARPRGPDFSAASFIVLSVVAALMGLPGLVIVVVRTVALGPEITSEERSRFLLTGIALFGTATALSYLAARIAWRKMYPKH